MKESDFSMLKDRFLKSGHGTLLGDTNSRGVPVEVLCAILHRFFPKSAQTATPMIGTIIPLSHALFSATTSLSEPADSNQIAVSKPLSTEDNYRVPLNSQDAEELPHECNDAASESVDGDQMDIVATSAMQAASTRPAAAPMHAAALLSELVKRYPGVDVETPARLDLNLTLASVEQQLLGLSASIKTLSANLLTEKDESKMLRHRAQDMELADATDQVGYMKGTYLSHHVHLV